MAKFQDIRALAGQQLQAVTKNGECWKAFLHTAAIAYNYNFPNQLLIYCQNPTATAVADMEYWNKEAGRQVKRGAHGIPILDVKKEMMALRYLFDISDTIPQARTDKGLPWAVTDQNWKPVWNKIIHDNQADSIQNALLMLSTAYVAQPTNVDMSNRLICFNINRLGEQLKPVAMISMLEFINTAVMNSNRKDANAATWVYFDEIYLLLRDEESAKFLYQSWKRFRKYNAYATGITQNAQDCLTNDTACAVLSNSEFVVMLRQTKDILPLRKLYGLSEPQQEYLKLATAGQGILKMGNNIIPFENKQPTTGKVYKLISTKPGEVE